MAFTRSRVRTPSAPPNPSTSWRDPSARGPAMDGARPPASPGCDWHPPSLRSDPLLRSGRIPLWVQTVGWRCQWAARDGSYPRKVRNVPTMCSNRVGAAGQWRAAGATRRMTTPSADQMRRYAVRPELADAHALPLPSDAAEPVPGPALGVGYCQDARFVFPDEEDEGVREAGEQGPPDLKGRVYVLKPRKGTRVPSDERESGLHLVQELAPQPLSSGFVPEDRFGQLVRDFRREPDMGHLRVRGMRSSIRVRGSSQVSPGRPARAARARRSTSAIHASPSRVSTSGSRLARSSAATRARSPSASWSASLSTSSAVVVTEEVYHLVSALENQKCQSGAFGRCRIVRDRGL